MTFDVAADAYDRFIGRYTEPLAGKFLGMAGVRAGERAVDVGCGPGALTARLVDLLGPESVAAVDPSEPLVAAARARCPGVDVRVAAAEDLPFPDGAFDAALAQLVVHFMAEPVQGLREMGRVVGDGGVVAACVWDHAGGTGPLSTFWQAVHELDPEATDESGLAGARKGHLGELAREAGLRDVEEGRLTVMAPYASFADWWDPFLLGVGPAGDYVAGLDDDDREALRSRCAELMPVGPFEVPASAWSVVAGG